ncbi:MAG: hypothetical protein CVT93_04725 [Bacteroidetes bacterium HGW-Bacteroidetes-10]|jgi:hypothetical protein|nr:MAG: hypothetical protein CVT93_04725 [Bacteroidetes bacterium HGW-Bacteroidetes-10]
MKKAVLAILILLAATSCKYLEFRSGDKVVAEVGGNKLYESEIKSLIPPGKSSQDSIMMLKQYINNWALKHLLIEKAENELSSTDKDVEQELEDYRSSLLMYRFEKMFIDQRLDTLITEQECRDYYEKNSPNFVLDNSVVKARFAKISNNSPNLEKLKRGYKASSIEEIDEFERLCYSSADKYNNFGNQWIDISMIAKEVPYDVLTLEREIKITSAVEVKDSLYTYLVFFHEKILPDQIAPFEYYLPGIKQIILSKRKQELIATLEQNLIREALEKNHLKTNINK